MRKMTIRTAVGLAAAVAATALTAVVAPAASATADSGLTFYRGTFATPVLHIADPDGTCTAFPATADSLTGSGTVERVVAFRTAGCTGQPVSLGTLRTFTAGEFRSFQAS